MGSGDFSSVRSYPRAFVPGAELLEGIEYELPPEEVKKFRNVLRLGTGDRVVVLPNDGRAVVCRLEGKSVVPEMSVRPGTDAQLALTLCLGVPKPDSLENSVRMATEIGVAHFCLFPAERTVVKWDAEKWDNRLRRLQTIAREAGEVCFRTILPTFSVLGNLKQVLEAHENAVVLSEMEGVEGVFGGFSGEKQGVIVVGPEGGWSPREIELIGNRGMTMGRRVMRVDTAVASACALALTGR